MIAYDYDPDATGAIQYGYGLDGSSCTYYPGQRPEGVTDQRHQVPTPGGRSPWGALQHTAPLLVPHVDSPAAADVQTVAVACETASHGGIWLAPPVAHAMPQWCQRYASRWSHGWGPQWYEEDTAAGLVLMSDPRLAEQMPGFLSHHRDFVAMFQSLPSIQQLDEQQRDEIAAQLEEWAQQLEAGEVGL